MENFLKQSFWTKLSSSSETNYITDLWKRHSTALIPLFTTLVHVRVVEPSQDHTVEFAHSSLY